MFKPLRKNPADGIEFCDRCSTVSDRRSRAHAARDREWRQLAAHGWRAAA